MGYSSAECIKIGFGFPMCYGGERFANVIW